MKLYYSKGACSLVPRIIMNELGLKPEYEAVDLKTKKTEHGQDYNQINLKSGVPALQLDNHELLTENAIILQYLADTQEATHLLPKVGDFKRYRVLEWLNYITTELHKSFGPLFNPKVTQEMQQQLFIPIIQTKLDHVNGQLQNKTFLLGDQFTLPDAYLFVMLFWANALKLELEDKHHLVRYFKNLGERKSVKDALQQEGFK